MFKIIIFSTVITSVLASPEIGSIIVKPLNPVPTRESTSSNTETYVTYLGDIEAQSDPDIEDNENVISEEYLREYFAPIAAPAPSPTPAINTKYAVTYPVIFRNLGTIISSPYAGIYGNPSLHGFGYGTFF
ncbi:hypothetical protein ACFFRR_011435 [Megaselia abdita]